MKLTGCKSALIPAVVYSPDYSKAVVPVLVLLFVALWFILRFVLSLALCYRELILVLFVRFFDSRLFGLVCILFLLLSGKGCDVIVALPGLFSYPFASIFSMLQSFVAPDTILAGSL